jgi:hypothetical protein
MLGREEFRVDTDNLVAQVKEPVNEGILQRVIIRNAEGETLFDVPPTVGMAGAAAAIFLAPALAALGIVVGLRKQIANISTRDPNRVVFGGLGASVSIVHLSPITLTRPMIRMSHKVLPISSMSH